MNNNLIYSKSLWNGRQGNECVDSKDYNTAINYYNNAIELYPMEYRYFVNRSFCFDQIREYEKALEDAIMAIMLNSDWGKCHFRKGRALKGLKRLQEAEICFFKVMQLQGNDCREAESELLSIRKLAIINFGIDSRTAFDLANKCFDMNEAINAIKQMEHFKNDDKSTDKLKPKMKRSNKNHNPLMRSKNSSYGRQQNFARSQPNANLRPEKTHSETNVGSDFKSINSIQVSNHGTNVLKKLSDILLNTNGNKNMTEDNGSNNKNENIESLIVKSPIKIGEKSDQKCPIDDNKSIKSLKSESNHSNYSNESKSRSTANKNRNGIKNSSNSNNNNLDQITERSITISSHNSSNSDTNRNSEPTNPWRLKGLWVSNIKPSDYSKNKLKEILGKFGKITFFGIIPESETAIIDFDNPESPRQAMSKLQGVHMPNICIDNMRLRIKFRPLYDTKNYPSINFATDRQLNNECYFWRTTGCNHYKFCKLKHIPVNKGVDLQPWMQSQKARYKRQNRQRFDTL